MDIKEFFNDPSIEKKREERRTYMREYKKKQYATNSKNILDKNKAYYYKTKCGLDCDIMLKYDTLLPYVARIKTDMNEFRKRDLTLSIEFVSTLLDDLLTEEYNQKNKPENITMVIQEIQPTEEV